MWPLTWRAMVTRLKSCVATHFDIVSGDQIEFSRPAHEDHQVIMASDIVFRMGVGVPDEAGKHGCVWN